MDFRQIISAFRHRHMQWSFMFSRFNGRPESRVSRSRRSICGSPRLCNRSAVCTLPLPAGIVPRGDPFARTVEMCFIVKFMFILFLPPTTAVQGKSGDGGGALRRGNHLVIPLSVSTNALVSGFKGRPYNPLYCSNDYWRLFRGPRRVWNLLTGNWRLCLPLWEAGEWSDGD